MSRIVDNGDLTQYTVATTVDGNGDDVQLVAVGVTAGAVTAAVTTANPLPVTGTLEIVNDVGSAIPVSGPATDAQLRATPLPVSGTIEITNDAGAAIPTSSAQLPAALVGGRVDVNVGNTVGVTGALTDAELRADPVDVQGPLTNAELRASPPFVDIESGTVTALAAAIGAAVPALTDTQLRASAVPVSFTDGTVTIADGEVDIANIESVDLDTGAGSVLRGAIGLLVAASGGPTAVSAAAPLPVTGTVAVSGSVEVVNDTGNPLPVSGTVAVSGSVAVTGPATDAQLRATPLPVSGTVAVTNADLATIAGAIKAEDSLHSSGDTGIMAHTVRTDTAAARATTDGEYQPIITDASGRVHVNVGAVVPGVGGTSLGKSVDASAGGTDTGVAMLMERVDTLGTLTPAVNDYARPRLTSRGAQWVTTDGDQSVAGNVASDAVDSGNPVKIGGIARTSDITAVANGDRVDRVHTILGKALVQPYALPGSLVSGTVNFTTTTPADVIAAQGAGVRTYITTIMVTNADDDVGTKVTIRDGTTAKWTGYARPDGGGFAPTLPVPLRGTANTAWTAICGTTAANVDVNLAGFTAID